MPGIGDLAAMGSEGTGISSTVTMSAIGGAEVASAASGVQSLVGTMVSLARNPVVAAWAGGKLKGETDKIAQSLVSMGDKFKIAGLAEFGGKLANIPSFYFRAGAAALAFGANVVKSADEAREATLAHMAVSRVGFDPDKQKGWSGSLGAEYKKGVKEAAEDIYKTIIRYTDESQKSAQELATTFAKYDQFFNVSMANEIQDFYTKTGMSARDSAEEVINWGLAFEGANLDAQSFIPLSSQLYSSLRLIGGTTEDAAKAYLFFADAMTQAADGSKEFYLSMDDVQGIVQSVSSMLQPGKQGLTQRATLGVLAQQGISEFPPHVVEALEQASQDKFQVGFGKLSGFQLSEVLRDMELAQKTYASLAQINRFAGTIGEVAWEAVGFPGEDLQHLRRLPGIPRGGDITGALDRGAVDDVIERGFRNYWHTRTRKYGWLGAKSIPDAFRSGFSDTSTEMQQRLNPDYSPQPSMLTPRVAGRAGGLARIDHGMRVPSNPQPEPQILKIGFTGVAERIFEIKQPSSNYVEQE